MKIVNLYSRIADELGRSKSFDLMSVMESEKKLKMQLNMALDWGINIGNVQKWMRSAQYKNHLQVAEKFTSKVHDYVKKVEDFFGAELKGEIWLSPSLMRFDGFARYDKGNHTVWFGVDHPDADEEYLKVLLSHELSHVYRDHQPDVWGFLGKPLSEVTRQEYLDHVTAEEHLVSEGLATLTSQAIYPEVALHVHHYYTPDEMSWCLQNKNKIDQAIKDCLKTDQDVWSFYEDDIIEPGSPSRVQYFWGALRIREWLEGKIKSESNYPQELIQVHQKHAEFFKDCIYQ